MPDNGSLLPRPLRALTVLSGGSPETNPPSFCKETPVM
jgi:hypothetical protein